MVIIEETLHLHAADDTHLTRHVRPNGHLRRVAVETVGEVSHELALEGKARALVLALLVVMHHVLEASPLHERHPLRRLAHILQRLAPQERPFLPMLHAVPPQDLQIQSLLVGIEVFLYLFLFVCGCKGSGFW